MNDNKIFDVKTLVAIVGIALPIILFSLSKKKKELSFKNMVLTEIISESSISSDTSITVYFENKKVNNLYALSTRLINSGNIPIIKSDLLNGLLIEFNDKLKILRYSISSTPTTIQPSAKISGVNKLFLNPDLINPNEYIDINFYLSCESQDLLPIVNSRLIGGEIVYLDLKQEIKPKSKITNRVFFTFEGLFFWLALIYSIFFIGLMIWTVYFYNELDIKTPLGKFLTFFFLSIGLICNIFYLIKTHF